jgi:hypothetical protein
VHVCLCEVKGVGACLVGWLGGDWLETDWGSSEMGTFGARSARKYVQVFPVRLGARRAREMCCLQDIPSKARDRVQELH